MKGHAWYRDVNTGASLLIYADLTAEEWEDPLAPFASLSDADKSYVGDPSYYEFISAEQHPDQ